MIIRRLAAGDGLSGAIGLLQRFFREEGFDTPDDAIARNTALMAGNGNCAILVAEDRELIAQLLENAEIKKLQPEINRAQRRKSFPYAIYYYFDDHGYIQMKVRKKNKIDAPGTAAILHELPDHQSAAGYLRGLTDRYALCMKKTDIDTGPGPCFYHQVGKCKGACIGLEDPDEYNVRVRQAVAATQQHFDEDFALVDQGRKPGEMSILLISKGRVMGWGYTEEDTQISHVNDVIDLIKARPSLPEDRKFVAHYIRMGKYGSLMKL